MQPRHWMPRSATRAGSHTHTLTHSHTHTHTHSRTRTRTNTLTHSHTYKHSRTLTHTQTHRHTQTYTHSHTHMHTHLPGWGPGPRTRAPCPVRGHSTSGTTGNRACSQGSGKWEGDARSGSGTLEVLPPNCGSGVGVMAQGIPKTRSMMHLPTCAVVIADRSHPSRLHMCVSRGKDEEGTATASRQAAIVVHPPTRLTTRTRGKPKSYGLTAAARRGRTHELTPRRKPRSTLAPPSCWETVGPVPLSQRVGVGRAARS
jgi:hypothetical protein